MIKTPKWLKEKIAASGERVLKRETTEEEAAARLARQITATDEQFALSVLTDYVRRQLKSWIANHRRVNLDSDTDGQLDMFPDLPRKLEVAPGRFVDQAWMTRRDWTAAVKQAKTKASNAGGFADAIERIAEKVLPLLTSDDLTTADVWPHRDQRQAGGDA